MKQRKEVTEEKFEELEDSGFELEIVDDTPEEDRNKPWYGRCGTADSRRRDCKHSDNVQKRIATEV